MKKTIKIILAAALSITIMLTMMISVSAGPNDTKAFILQRMHFDSMEEFIIGIFISISTPLLFFLY